MYGHALTQKKENYERKEGIHACTSPKYDTQSSPIPAEDAIPVNASVKAHVLVGTVAVTVVSVSGCAIRAVSAAMWGLGSASGSDEGDGDESRYGN